MKNIHQFRPLLFLFIIYGLLFSGNYVQAQSDWKLKKQKDGIKVYVKNTQDNPILSYKIVTEIEASLEAVYQQVVDFQENKKYLETIKNIEVLEEQTAEYVIVYMVFDMPWPFTDRDLVNKMKINKGPEIITLHSNPANSMVEQSENTIRLKEFHETWKLEKITSKKTRLFLEGHADPGMFFPNWIINLFVVNEPYSLIKGIKTESQKNP